MAQITYVDRMIDAMPVVDAFVHEHTLSPTHARTRSAESVTLPACSHLLSRKTEFAVECGRAAKDAVTYAAH
ncbi:hypothetical protein ABH922_005473 [Rhodococcus sp. 27YEA15]